MPANPLGLIFQRPARFVVVDPSASEGVRFRVTVRPRLHAPLLEVTVPLNVSALPLIVTWEAIVTVLVAYAAPRTARRRSVAADAPTSARVRTLRGMSNPFRGVHSRGGTLPHKRYRPLPRSAPAEESAVTHRAP